MSNPVPKSCKNRKFISVLNTADETAVPTESFSIMSYNVLSQKNIRRTMFPYASSNSLKWKFRKGNLLSEIKHLRPDIICLQEVTIDHYHQVFQPEFTKWGYIGELHFSYGKNHGVAIMCLKEKFSIVSNMRIELGCQRNPNDPDSFYIPDNIAQIFVLEFNENSSTDSLIQSTNSNNSIPTTPNVESPLELDSQSENELDIGMPNKKHKSSNESLETSFKESHKNRIIVANTHLYWKPDGGFERFQQMTKILSCCKQLSADNKYPLLMCGDFNTTPDDTLYTLLTCPKPLKLSLDMTEQLLPTTTDYDSSEEQDDFPDGSNTDEKITQQLLEAQKNIDSIYNNDLNMVNSKLNKFYSDFKNYTFFSSYSNYSQYDESHLNNPKWTGEPLYTNYTNWKGTLDYIMIQRFPFKDTETNSINKCSTNNNSQAFVLKEILSIPNTTFLIPGLPNEVFSSDHISIMAKIDYYKN
ncbi:RNA exonuclease NGL2 [Smittium culicis]|uniref:RNA exonuclease NGL2 n=1 Tax=Smittium culicis TaxID=133412 RepID=A0A1R1Y579_9FUNG|nr:RNA exonuclease NGL2 [Smittium culicis]OMJ21906.1 RNA exonuclease NGL2 [Smittium culicis]